MSKHKETCLKNSNVLYDHPMKNPKNKEKVRNSNKIQNKIEYPMLISEEGRINNFKARWPHITDEIIEILHTKELFVDVIKNMSISEMAKQFGVTKGTIRKYSRLHGLKITKPCSSSQEDEIAAWLTSNNIIFSHPDRIQIKPYELDFYFPNKNIALEIQGDYWHMNPAIYEATDKIRKGKTAEEIWKYDKMKADLCESIGLKLIVIWESEWEDNKDELKEMLLKSLKWVFFNILYKYY